MATNALLSAAGLLNPDTKLLKISTATEHATSASSTATEHAPAASTDDVSRLPLTGLPMSTSELETTIGEDLENCRTASVDGSGFPIEHQRC